MSTKLFVATRKGLFTVTRNTSTAWKISEPNFIGVPVSVVLPDSRDGSVYAALDHGHFGTKLHRSLDGGKSWEEVTAPAYPQKPEDAEDVVDTFRNLVLPWDLKQVWSLETGGADAPGT